MAAQIPSMSVPNWLSIITGVRPENHGVLGNMFVPETNFDSIFRVVKHYDDLYIRANNGQRLMRGLTGSTWFANIVKTQLDTLNGDGTLDTDSLDDSSPLTDGVWFGDHLKYTADPADWMRGKLWTTIFILEVYTKLCVL